VNADSRRGAPLSPLHTLSAAELARAFAAHELSPVEVTRAALARIEAFEPRLHALYAPQPEAALAAARASERRHQQGAALSVLDGVPLTIKENIATQGTPVPLGTAAVALQPAAEDAPPAARLREAGGVLLAKTTMPDFGMLTSGLSSFHALTRNPWNLSKNPGGSSAGAAAAAAACYAPLHLGTDIGGSVRLPAGWCGIVGFKPSLGRVPIQPPYAGRVAGPMTRSVADAALMMAALSQPDWRDAMSLPAQPIDWLHQTDGRSLRDVRGLRLGVWLDPGWGIALRADVRALVESAAQRFASAGAQIIELKPFVTRHMMDGLDHFWRMRSYLDIGKLPAEAQAKVLPYIRAWVATAQGLSAAQVFEGYSQMGAMRDASVAAFQGLDYVLSPVCPVTACNAELASPLNDPMRPFEHIAFTVPFNMSEQPSLAVPAGVGDDGLPVGLQITGHRHDDLGVLQMGALWEALRPALPPYPEL
jgi:Asp-tRNA(Asn)/Glu-tRNA(Gln) amidotransferase A subunit family amidase